MVLVSTPDMTMLAFAVVAATVGSLHNTSGTISTLVVAVTMVTRFCRGLRGLIKDHNESDEHSG